MAARILDGKKRAEEIKRSIKKQVGFLSADYKKRPKLVALQMGNNSSSSVYIKSQEKTARELGLEYELINMNRSSREDDFIKAINELNSDTDITGIIIQLPLPARFNLDIIYSAISPLKDAEGLHPENMGRLFLKDYRIVSPTAMAVIELIRMSGIDLYGKEAVIIGHSEIVGKPLGIILLNDFATVSVCHIATSERKRLTSHIKRAEILIVAVGKPNLVKGEWIRKGAIIIDVGINKLGKKIVGDVEFEKAAKKASYITPVPGGVGPLTTAMLMQNCVKLFKLQRSL
jgi:methylenetetrahydrofolate dehydrogenase (NADP+)/methenyltetrahydrofolate cyclohydrolase